MPVVAAAVAGGVSGLPSTTHALLTGGDPLAATRAAGAMVLGPRRPALVLLAAGAVVHGALSLGWAAVLARTLPTRHTATWGAIAGLGIAAVDLGMIGRHIPAIRRLPTGPQVADHLLFGAVAGAVIAVRRAPARRTAARPARPHGRAPRT